MNKVCIVTSAIPPTHSGAGVAAFKYAYRLYKKGRLGLLVTRTKTKLPSQDYYQYIGEFDDGFEFKIKRTTAKLAESNLLTKLFYYPVDFTFLYAVTIWILIKNRQCYGILHCFSPTWFSLVAILIGKLMGKKVVLEITRLDGDDPGYVARYDKFYILYQRRNIQYLLADALICLSPALVERCKTNKFINKNKIHLIPRAFNENVFYPVQNKKMVKESLGLAESNPVLLFVGGIIPRKGVHILIEILRRLKAEYPEVKLILAGPFGNSEADQKYKFFIENQITKNKLKSNILFTTYITNVDKYMKASDIFLFPSYSEGLPNVVIEAMGCGLVVIMNNIKGISEFIINNLKDGFIVTNNDIDKYKEIINYCLINKKFYNYISDNAVKRSRKQFSLNNIDNQYIRLYKNLLNS